MNKEALGESIFTEEDIAMLADVFSTRDKELIRDIIYDLGHDIHLAYYPSRNILSWPWGGAASQAAWITHAINRRDYEALVNNHMITNDEGAQEDITLSEAKTFVAHYRQKFGDEWKILNGWARFWLAGDGIIKENRIYIVKYVGNPKTNIKKIAKCMSPPLKKV